MCMPTVDVLRCRLLREVISACEVVLGGGGGCDGAIVEGDPVSDSSSDVLRRRGSSGRLVRPGLLPIALVEVELGYCRGGVWRCRTLADIPSVLRLLLGRLLEPTLGVACSGGDVGGVIGTGVCGCGVYITTDCGPVDDKTGELDCAD